jgi:hypothetical protein
VSSVSGRPFLDLSGPCHQLGARKLPCLETWATALLFFAVAIAIAAFAIMAFDVLVKGALGLTFSSLSFTASMFSIDFHSLASLTVRPRSSDQSARISWNCDRGVTRNETFGDRIRKDWASDQLIHYAFEAVHRTDAQMYVDGFPADKLVKVQVNAYIPNMGWAANEAHERDERILHLEQVVARAGLWTNGGSDVTGERHPAHFQAICVDYDAATDVTKMGQRETEGKLPTTQFLFMLVENVVDLVAELAGQREEAG